MQSVIQSTNDKGDGILELHIWNGTTASEFVYYEDDGVSYDYQNGGYYKRVIRFDPQGNIVTLSPVEGDFKSKYQQLKFIAHGFENADKSLTIIGSW